MIDYSCMGQRIKAKRKELHLTQEQFAEMVGVSSSFLGHIERGTRKASIDTLFAICGALHVSSDYLIGLSSEAAIQPILSDLTQGEIEAGIKLLKRITGKLHSS